MKIKQATIYGFGKWVNFEIDFSVNPMICIYGENESGKSTLQKFILFMLFGFPPKKRNFYRPKTSGRMGGRLTIEDSSIGTYIIERFDEVNNGAATCYMSDGQQFNDKWLKEQLKGMTYETYQSIFSFSALDLTKFKHMKDEDLSEIILGIGLTGSTEIYSIEKDLDNKLGELFKPYGKNPLINEQLNTLDELQKSLSSFNNNASTYRNYQERISTLESEIKTLELTIKENRERHTSIERQLNALPMIYEHRENKEALSSLPTKVNFPESGLKRLQLLKDSLLPLYSERLIYKDSQKEAMAKMKELDKQLFEADFYERAEDVIQKKQQYVENKNESKKIKKLMGEQDAQIKIKLKELNIGLKTEDLGEIVFPFHIEQLWSEISNRSDRLRLEIEQHELERDSLTKQQDVLSNEYEAFKEKTLTNEQVESIEEKLDAYKESKFKRQFFENNNQQEKQWRKTKKNNKQQMNFLLIGAVFLSLFISGLTFFLKTPKLLFFAALFLIAGAGQWVLRNHFLQETEEIWLLKQNKQEFPSRITQAEKEEMERLLTLNNKYKSELLTVMTQLKSIDVQLIKWNEKNDALQRQKIRLDEQINAQIKDYPFLKDVNILFWPELYYSLIYLIPLYEEQIKNMEYLNKIDSNIILFQDKIDHLLLEIKQDISSLSPMDKVELIEQEVETFNNSEHLIQQYEKNLLTINAKLNEVEKNIATYEREKLKLFTIAGVKTEEAYYQKAKQFEEQNNAREGVNRTYQQLLNLFNKEEIDQLMGKKLEKHTLQFNNKQLTQKINELEIYLSDKKDMLATLNVEILQMESSESYSETMHEFNMEEEKLAALVIEWSVLKTAKEMLNQTKYNYRNKYLSRVLEKTSTYFSFITDNAYMKVFSPVEGQGFRVESHDEIHYSVAELSQGTVDQLYISLRLAISEVMSEEHRLPFIIDDAFVHFDIVRTNKMLDLLTHITEKQQIIIFTCKKSVAKYFSSSYVVRLDEEKHAAI